MLDKWYAYQDTVLPNWSTVMDFTWSSLDLTNMQGDLSPVFSDDPSSGTYRLDWKISSSPFSHCSIEVFDVVPDFDPKASPTYSLGVMPVLTKSILMDLPDVQVGSHGRLSMRWKGLGSGGRLFVDPTSTCGSAEFKLLRYQD